MITRTSDDFDLVTLLQMRDGVQLYRCIFEEGASKTYVYKSTFNLVPGDFVVVKPSNSLGSICKVIEVVQDIQPGIDYRWIIGVADMGEAESILKIDKSVCRALAMSRAMKEAEDLRQQIESIETLPKVIESNKK